MQLKKQIILSPYTAKQMALLLGAVIQQYEKQFGVREVGPAPAQTNPAAETGRML